MDGREVIDRFLTLLPVRTDPAAVILIMSSSVPTTDGVGVGDCLQGLMSTKGAVFMVTVADNKPREIMAAMRERGFCCKVSCWV